MLYIHVIETKLPLKSR